MANKIMVVDDEPDVVDLVKLVLESDGFNVVTAYGGKRSPGEDRPGDARLSAPGHHDAADGRLGSL